MTEVSEDYLRKLFVRLQLGLLLNTGEKLHATTGSMQKFVFDDFVHHPFIESVRIADRRFARQTLCAQICINSFSSARLDQFSRTRYEDLKSFFDEYSKPTGENRKFLDTQSERILEVCELLIKHFKSHANLLRNRSLILTVYLFVEEMFYHSPRKCERMMKKFVDFITLLVRRLKDESQAGFNRKNEQLYVFQSYLSTAPSEKYQIERRHKKLGELYKYYQRESKILGD